MELVRGFALDALDTFKTLSAYGINRRREASEFKMSVSILC